MLLTSSSWSVSAVLLAALLSTGATCSNGTGEAPKASKPAPSEPATGGSPPAPAANAPKATAVLSGIPGMDFSALPESSKAELATVFTDEFCYCGCPHTLGACLRQHTGCKHARRMAVLAAGEAAAGASASEVILSLSKYYQAFGQSRAGFKADERMCQGPKDAKVTLVEFSDFECPHCLAALPVLEGFVKQNGKVRLCWRPFPLSFPHSQQTAQAALFARDNGKFWAVHDALFERSMGMSPEAIAQALTANGLSVADFKKAVASGKYTEELTSSKEQGKAAGVDSTPSLFFNGRKLNLPLTQELLTHTTDDELEWQGNKGAWAAE